MQQTITSVEVSSRSFHSTALSKRRRGLAASRGYGFAQNTGSGGVASTPLRGGQGPPDLDPMSRAVPDLIADLDALETRLRARAAAEGDPAVLAESARVVGAVAAALGIGSGRLARELGIANEKTVREWIAAKTLPWPLAVCAMRLMVERLVRPPPPELAMEAGRVAPCAEALAPHLEALAGRAEAAGWHPDEIAAAARAWAASRAGAGP